MPDAVAAASCAKCQAALQPDERFCPSCGAPTEASRDVAPSPWTQVIAQLQAATLGEFEVSRELGRGGMAAVYLAHEIALNRLVAIKVMAPGLFLGPGMVDRFRQEAVTVANLSHPNIITIHGVRQIDDLHFLVMKFIEGRSLESVLHSAGTLPVSVVRAALFQVGSGLAYAHRRGVIHRDIKPANILLDADGNAIVTDFGIAKLTEHEGQTQTGTMIGTPGYMSPEQCYGGQVTWSSDLYSLGIVAYELLTGTVPFTGTTFNVMQAHTITPPPSIRERRADCPADLEAAVLQMLAKTPAERFETMTAALSALNAAPLVPGDPVRDELERLAIPDPASRGSSTIRPAISPIPRSGPRVGQLTLTGAPDVIAAGDRFELRSTVRSDAGAPLAGRAVLWSSTDDSIAAVTANGVVTARAPGRVNISATCEGVIASLPMTVLPPGAGRPARRGSGRMIGAGVGAVVVLAAGIYLTTHRAAVASPTSIPPAPPSHQSDTAPGPLLAPPPPPQASPKPPSTTIAATSPKKPPATRVDTPAVAKQGAATSAAATLPPPAPAPPPVVVAQPPPAPVTPALSAAEVTRGVEGAVQLYVDAIRARSTDQMRKVYPNLAASVAADWKNQFAMVGQDGVDRLDVAVSDIKVTPGSTGESATAQFTLKLTLQQRRGDSQSSTIVLRGALHRDGSNWRFDALDQQRAGR